jgi:mRNA-degrading endonuclease RelE of RelBE toxin-antitoxin system
MIIVEFPAFTRAITALLSEEEYAELQWTLVRRPDIGDIIPSCKGLRKMRWRLRDKGKRGGMRIIYYWVTAADQILMLIAYAKNKQDDLTEAQKQILVKLVEEELENG